MTSSPYPASAHVDEARWSGLVSTDMFLLDSLLINGISWTLETLVTTAEGEHAPVYRVAQPSRKTS